ncbi:MAG: hsp70 family protein [bacterium]|nr:hsp70 family protein [bacterium]
MTERGRKWIAGIDLGTTNSAVSRIAADDEQGTLENVPIIQRVSADQTAARPFLPSFLYLPGAHELPEGAAALPWDADRSYITGEFARVQSSRIPGRVVSSAKSWLAHRRAEPQTPILPWEALKDTRKISAVEASRRYLSHMAESWDYQAPLYPLALQDIVLTVPASFDEAARELTVAAADMAGLERITLLEEPQAAFYAWLYEHPNWNKELSGRHEILVLDIGGGTSDFTVIRIGEDGLERIAVGDHLMLGGDNFDIALAHILEPRFKGKLDLMQWGILRHECRRAKELLLGTEPPEKCTVTVPGSGSKLLGGSLTAELGREETEKLILGGFFPETSLEEKPETARAGLRELGLPYASDPAVPRHLAAFLTAHNLKPDTILFNGGACRPDAIRKRACHILQGWFGHEILEISNSAPDLAVAQGAAYFGWLKAKGKERIRGGIARSYYMGVSQEKAVCVIKRSQDEGEKVFLDEPVLKLSVGRPVSFPLYAASDRAEDKSGEIVDTSLLKEAGILETVINGAKNERGEAEVTLSAIVTEIGTLEIWAKDINSRRQWSLELPLRGKKRQKAKLSFESVLVDNCKETITSTLALKPSKLESSALRPRNLLNALEEKLGKRDAWPPALTRSLWEAFLAVKDKRKTSPEHEAAWLNGCGFMLRPGLGYPLDAWRQEQMHDILGSWLQNPNDERVRREWWIFWRRIAAGMTELSQNELWAQMAPKLIPGRRHIKSRIKNLLPSENTEFMRLAVSLERIAVNEKLALGQILSQDFKAKQEKCWQLARLFSRTLIGGGPHNVIPPEDAVPYAEKLLSCKWPDPRPAALALSDICRFTGVRSLDMPEELRISAAQRLTKEDFPDLAKTVLEIVEQEDEDKARLLGDTLPIGLRL